MVDVFGKAAFLTSQLPQAAAAAECAELLQLVPESPVSVANVLDRLAGVDFPIAICGDVRDTQVDTERTIRLEQFWCFDFASGKHVPRAANEHQIALTALVFEQRALPLTAHEWDRLSAIQCPDRDQRIGERKRKNAVIVGNRAVRYKRPQRRPIQLVGIRNLSDTAHRELRGKVKRLTRRLIRQFVDGKLTKCLSRKGNLTDIVARSIGRLKRAPERISLFGCRLQFQLDGEFHLAAFLVLNVVLDRFRRDVSGAANIGRTAPQRRQARTQMQKLIAQDAGGIALELIGKLLRRVDRRAIHTQMQVIGHHFKRLDGAMQFGCLLMQPFFQTLRNCARQHLAAVLRTPDEVVIDRRDATSNVAIPFSTHVLRYTSLFDTCQLTNNVGGRASSASLKGAFSARTFL